MGTTFHDLSTELVLELTRHLSAADTVRFLSVNALFYRLTAGKAFWRSQALKLFCNHGAPSSSLDIDDLSEEELRQIATRPFRFERDLINGTLNRPVARSINRAIVDPQDEAAACVEVRLIPGGRWLVTLYKSPAHMLSLKIWDLKDASEGRVALAAKNGRGTLFGPRHELAVREDRLGLGALILVRAEATQPRRTCLVALRFDPSNGGQPLKLINAANFSLDLSLGDMLVTNSYLALPIGGAGWGVLVWDWQANRLRMFADDASGTSKYTRPSGLLLTDRAAWFWNAPFPSHQPEIIRLAWTESLSALSQGRRFRVGDGSIVERKDSATITSITLPVTKETLRSGLPSVMVTSPWDSGETLLILSSAHLDACLATLDARTGIVEEWGLYKLEPRFRPPFPSKEFLAGTPRSNAILYEAYDSFSIFTRGQGQNRLIRATIDCSAGVWRIVDAGMPFACVLSGTVGWVRRDGSIDFWRYT